MSSGLHLAREATLVVPERELEIFLTASKSPSELAANPASMISTPSKFN